MEVALGALVAIFVAVTVEYLRKPRLRLDIAKPEDIEYEPDKQPARKVRQLRVILSNRRLPLIARWMSRNSATLCTGAISFHHLDGQNIFGRSMSIRWSATPNPTPKIIFHLNKFWGEILDLQPAIDSRVDVPRVNIRCLMLRRDLTTNRNAMVGATRVSLQVQNGEFKNGEFHQDDISSVSR